MIMKGFSNNIARINLYNSKVTFESSSELYYRKYLGGRGIIVDTLLKEVPRKADPLGTDTRKVSVLAANWIHPIPKPA